jgi:hypothetical protein
VVVPFTETRTPEKDWRGVEQGEHDFFDYSQVYLRFL